LSTLLQPYKLGFQKQRSYDGVKREWNQGQRNTRPRFSNSKRMSILKAIKLKSEILWQGYDFKSPKTIFPFKSSNSFFVLYLIILVRDRSHGEQGPNLLNF